MSEGEIAPAPRKSKVKKILLYLLGFIVFTVVAEQVWYRHTFPYGWSHACSVGLGLGLRGYASKHNGWFPHGEATPEASLSLLYKDDPVTALWTLGGKNIPGKTVEATLKQDGKLTPATCGWHYVEGLRDDDDDRIPIAWDKVVGLGHNGQRRSDIMHEVILLDGSHQFIPKQKWPEFVANEKRLLANLMKFRDSNAPPIRWSDEESLGPNQTFLK